MVVAGAGRHRVYHDPDPRERPELAGSIDSEFWTALGIVDRLKGVHTVSPVVELHVAFLEGERYGPDEVRTLEDLVRGLGPWARRVTLLHGFAEGCTPLSPRERQVACAMLGSNPVKIIAAELELSEARTRELVRAVYGKLKVRSRAELAALWAGSSTSAPRQSSSARAPAVGSPKAERRPPVPFVQPLSARGRPSPGRFHRYSCGLTPN